MARSSFTPSMSWRARAFAGVLLAAGLSRPGSASAFCRSTTVPVPPSYSPARGCFTEGLPLFWRGACVGYAVNERGSAEVKVDQAARLIEQAFSTWNAARCSATDAPVGISARSLGTVRCGAIGYNSADANQNVVVFRDEAWPYADPFSTLGLTTVTFDPATGEIYDADIEINASGKNVSTADSTPASGFDLLSVLTHEAGHFFGVAHATNPQATMYPTYNQRSLGLRKITGDDVAALCEIYPNASERNVAEAARNAGLASATSCDATPRHDFSASCNGQEKRPDGPIVSACALSSSRRSDGSALLGSALAVSLAIARRVRRALRR